MSDERTHPILRFIRKLAATGELRQLPDCQLLKRYAAHGDEAAFTILVRRHGGMVWHVCRGVLGDSQAAEDAFQATFLILIRKVRSIARPELLGNWLYGVAYRVAHRARKTMTHVQAHERQGVETVSVPAVDDAGGQDLQCVIQEELQRLPAKYRCPMLLCYLQGRTNEEAARQLHWPVGTLKVRLLRGREMLRKRLTRRGLALSAAALAGELSKNAVSAMPALLTDTTTKAAFLFAAGQSMGTKVLSAQAVALAQGVFKTMSWTSLKTVTTALLTAVLLRAGLFTYRMLAADVDLAKPPKEAAAVPLPVNGRKEQIKVKTDAEKLQGTWNVVALETDGMQMPENTVKGAKIVIEGTNFTTISMGATYKGTFKVDPASMPRTLDLTFTDGPEKGNTALGIYELDGDGWKICLAVNAKDRPKEFAAKAGSGFALETLKRETQETAQDALKKEMALLEGEWSMVSGEIGGQPLPEAFAKSAKRTAKGNETTVMMNGQLFMKATFTIDPVKKPKTIDYLMTDGPSKGKTQYGIYEADGSTVRFCFASPGKDRPTVFATKAGDDNTLSVWTKIKLKDKL